MRGLFVYTPILKVHITTPTGTHHRHPTVPRVSGARHRHVDQIGFSSERPHQMGTPKCTPGGGTLGEESVSLKLTRLMSLGLCPGDLILPLMFFMPLVPAEKNMGHQNGFRKGVKTPPTSLHTQPGEGYRQERLFHQGEPRFWCPPFPPALEGL